MKRIALAVFMVLLLAGGLSAQQETWIDTSGLPRGMLIDVTQGLMYDEWDIIFRSPAELSNYSGIGVYTAYGNYDDPGYTVNPFSTTTVNTGNFGDFQLGFTTDILGMRAGILGGFTRTTIGKITITEDLTPSVNPTTNWQYNRTVNADGEPDGTADYSYTQAIDVSNFSQNHSNKWILGLDLGPIGASLLFSHSDVREFMGGTTSYTWTKGSDNDFTTPNDQITSFTTEYGGNEGKNVVVSDTGSWDLMILGDLPLSLFGEGTPVTASLEIGYEPNSPSDMPVTTTLTTTNVTGAANAEQNSTLTVTSSTLDLLGDAKTFGGNPGTIPPPVEWIDSIFSVVDATRDEASLLALADSGLAKQRAQNPAESAGGTFSLGINAKMDPRFSLSEIVALRTRAGIGYSIASGETTTNESYSISLDLANGAADLSSYTNSSTKTAKDTIITNTLNPELAGILEFTTANDRLALSTGLVYHPTFEFEATTKANEVTTTNYSWTDATNTDPDAVAATTANNIETRAAQGSAVVTETTVFADKDTHNTYEQTLTIPVGVRLDIVPQKFQLFGGYRLDHTATTHVYTAAGSTTTTVTTVNNVAGTTVSPDPADTAVSTTKDEVTTQKTTSTWTGSMDFMLRWMPLENMTIDLIGTGIMNALNFDFLGGNTGNNVNFDRILSNLRLSVSFRF
ncbi:hypothetical protein [Spirochaeta lutea]|uniref:Outer membrane protein beta-barrel domain-containing protein n=1 Tax=Spirochaeta lutea TaxID=1480694 RepID=A0A098QU24_9SPIO|nr:hypothetical protein [Spirochaeta lutea]KGE71106.1 hypothetical protein DC28_12710 [Spirochaeta lutea]